MILLVLDTGSAYFITPILRTLRMLGIEYQVAPADSTGVHLPVGRIAWTDDTAMRNALKAYDAVLVIQTRNLTTFSPNIRRAYRWLSWNNPDDTPVAYLGVDHRVQYTDIDGFIPSDFPVIRPDTTNLAATTYAYTTTHELHNTAGLRAQLAEGEEIYVNSACLHDNASGAINSYLYRLNLAAHESLGSNGEILARPVSEDVSFGSDAVIAYRYRNRYLFPMLYPDAGRRFDNGLGPINRQTFWLLYALKHLGIQPRYSIPMMLVMDDAMMLYFPVSGNPPGLPTYAQMARIGYETYRYLAEQFYPRTGCAMVCGLFMGGRYGRTGGHWGMVQNGVWINESLDAETRNWLQQWHNLLVRHHHGALPCTIHDHSLDLHCNRNFSNFRRHSDAGYAYAAPNDVPITRGTQIVRADSYAGTLPSDARERWIGGERYYEWGYQTSGTGDTIPTFTPNNYHAARLAYETAVAEMRALGFPDAHGSDNYRLMIKPNNRVGDPAEWRALRDIGYQAIRCRPYRNLETPTPDTNPAPPQLQFEGLHFFGTTGRIDATGQYGATLGLYYPGYTTYNPQWVNVGDDVGSLWNTDRPTAARRAYRRYVASSTESALYQTTGDNLIMIHPCNVLTWADPADPLRPFDPNDPDSRINFLLEVAWNVEKMVGVLYPYLKFGTVKELVALRERVLG
jgi:hypothetical protein